MRDDGTIVELDHRMNLGLALDDNDDIVHTHVKQMLGFDTLKPLVHKGRRIDGDLGTHIPRGMSQRIGRGDRSKLIARATKERTTRARKPDAVRLTRILALIALENRRMFGINGKHLARLDHGHNKVAAHNERFPCWQGPHPAAIS